MTEKNVLSQEEIDALLESVDETTPENRNSTPNKDFSAEQSKYGDEVKTLNFSSQDRLVEGKLPVLDRIYDRTVRSFATDIYQLTGKDFDISQHELQIIKHSQFMESLPNPTLMSIYKFKPLRGKGFILFDSTFVYYLVDYYFGGGNSSQFFSQKERTDFTATELRVMETVMEKLVLNLSSAWKPILELEISKFNDETNPQLVNITEPDELLLVVRFSLDFGKETGSFSFVLPYTMVEPIKEQLELGASRPEDEIDPNWLKLLKEELMEVDLNVSSAMAHAKSTLGAVMDWQVGDFIPVEMKEIVTLDVEGTPGFTAMLGTANEKRALKIIKHISY